MPRLLPLAVLLLTLTSSSRADEFIRAPVPKPQEVPAIDGSYTLNYTVVSTTFAGGGFAKGGAGPMPVARILLRSSRATISKNEITIGGGGFGGGYGGYADEYDDPRMSRLAATPSMTYAIDPKQTPMAIDITSTDARNKKTKSLGIIEVSDDRITMAVAKPGGERPKNMEETEEVTVYYFKKTPPPTPLKTEFRIVAMTVGKEAEVEKELTKLAGEGFELVNTTNPAAADPKAAPTTVHFILKRTVR